MMLEIKNIGVSLGSFAMKNISLEVEQGDYLTVLGLSGAGKTVLLELLAGLVKPDQGQILFRGKNISQTSIQSRPFGLVYQDMALFPHMSVEKNIEYPLKSRKIRSVDKERKVQSLASDMRISHLLQRHPGTLSGGEAQRVALARVLAADPEILLLDEPLASLDVKLKQDLRELLKEINRSGKTIIHVTHDHMEAATLSKKVAIIENGELLQWGRPEEVFRRPVSEFVARFSGIKNIFLCKFDDISPEASIYEGISEKGTHIKLLEPPVKNNMHVMIPGEDIIVSEHALETSAVNQFKGFIKDSYFLNHGVELIINAGEDFSVMVSQKSTENLGLIPGKQVWINFKASAVKLL
jgi:molybdate/tungstate transport system ATP-binding protein